MKYSLHTVYTVLVTLAFMPSLAVASDYVIDAGQTGTISDTRNLVAQDRIDNQGVMDITGSGILNIALGVVNANPATDIQGLDLGVVRNVGAIDAEDFIRFQEGSEIGGIVISGGNIAFDGASTITGSVTAKQLIINASKERDDEGNVKVFAIDLTGSGSALDVEELVVNSVTKIDMKEGETLVLDALYLGGAAGTSLVVSENIRVTGNYTGTQGTTIGSKMDDNGKPQGTISLLGGGPAVDGENNVIAQSAIFAAKLEVKNNTAIERILQVHGDLVVLEGDDGDNPSRLLLHGGVLTVGKLTVQKNGIIRIDQSEQETMIPQSNYAYNGVFLGGFELLDNAVMDVVTEGEEPDRSISVAIGDTSTMATNAKMEARTITLAGVTPDGLGASKVQEVVNEGSIKAGEHLTLNNIKLQNVQAGKIEAGSMTLLGASVLDLAQSDQSNGGLTFIGDKRKLEIDAQASIRAEDKTLDFTGVEVIHYNRNDKKVAITADQLHFGNGSSLAGAGIYDSDATFKAGSTAKLDYTGKIDFHDNDVTFERDSTIELTIGGGVYALETTGKITVNEGVKLEIVDGSQFNGRKQWFKILQGSNDSEYADGLSLGQATLDSLFFTLSDTITGDDEGGVHGALIVEIVKSNSLVDYAKSSNQRNLSNMIDRVIKEGRVTENQGIVFDAIMRIPDDHLFRGALNDLSGASRENAVLYSLTAPWQRAFNSIGFNRLSLALPSHVATHENGMALGQSWQPKMPKIGRPRWSPAHDLWADMYYSYTQLNDDGNASGGYGNRGGFFAGTALPSPSKESLLGLAIGYSAAQYKQGLDKTESGDFQLGLYGGMNLFARNLQLRGYLGYGMQDYKHNRTSDLYGIGPLSTSGKSSGDSISAALYLIRPVDVSDRYLLKPMMGFDFESVSQDGFSETGVAAVALDYGKTSIDRLMWRLGFTGDYQFERFEMTGRFLYGLKISGDNAALSTHRFMPPGNDPFVVRSVNIGDYAFDLGLGGNWNLNRRRTAKLFFDYNANLAKNSSVHTTSLGILWRR